MKIELYYFEGCPTYHEAKINLKAVLKELSIDDEIDMILVESPDHAQELKFQGSPSIVIDGIDLESKNDPALYGCRIYEIEGKLTGTPTKQFIKEKIDKLIRKNAI